MSSETNNSAPICPQCGGPLDPSLLSGGCGACLIGGLIAGEAAAQSEGGGVPVIAGYEVLEEIGRGGMGVVFRARQDSSRREVALKMVAPDTLRALEARRRFLMEVEAMAAVQHPALLPLYDAGEDAYGRPWLAMQFAAGGTLSARLNTYARQWRRSAELLVTLARAIAYAHERGLLHRDLKPANILFDATDHPYIADFGLAKWAEEDGSVTRTASVLGSPAYLAPEAVASGSKATTTVSDVYGLGAIFYELLCGARPYAGASAPEILTLIRERPPAALRAKRPDIPRDLEVIVLKAMSREPTQRYASAAALADDLQRWLDGLPILARPLGIVGRLANWARRKPAQAALSALLIGSLFSGGAMVWRESQRRAVAQAAAEARVDFMTRELPSLLAPLGRLDILEPVFENVGDYFSQYPDSTPEQLARRADFLTQWAQILSPRGDAKGVLSRLEEALALARKAAPDRGSADLRAARARVLAGWRMGEALIKNNELDRAASTLNETLAFATAQQTEDLEFRTLVARLALEPAFLEGKKGAHDKALAAATESLRQWTALRPRLLADGSAKSQEALITAAQTHLMLAQTHRSLDDQSANDASLVQAMEDASQLVNWKPENLRFTYHQALTLLSAGEFMAAPPRPKRSLFDEADGLLVGLLDQEPSNVHWRIAASESALKRYEAAKASSNEDELKRIALEAEDRSLPLHRLLISDLEHLRLLSRFGMFCGSFFYKHKDWPKVQEHWRFALRSIRRASRLSGTQGLADILRERTTKATELLTAAIGAEAAQAWLAEFEKESNP